MSKQEKAMTVDEAIKQVLDEFPFEDYLTPNGVLKNSYPNIAHTVVRYLPPGSPILDFGSGPCDKTAILQHLGYQCTAYDDLQDYWHKLPGNKERILSYAESCGIDFVEAGGEELPFEKNTFDMVMMHDVLEHLHNSPRNLLNDLLELAKPEGLLFITVPNAANIRKRLDLLRGKTNLPRYDLFYWYPGEWRGHIREYVRDDLEKLARYLNLDVLELKGTDHMIRRLPQFIRPLYLLVTGIFKGWKDSWMLVARKPTNWEPKRTLSEEELTEVFGDRTSYNYSE
jgi:SAM-dependent methyltransferase